MTKRAAIVTYESFIARSNIVHDSKYDYSLSKYTGYREKLDIICPIHGQFQRSPAAHLSAKRGCPVCSPTRRKTTSEFIENATKIHGDRYDYSLVEYINSSTKVNIICKKHGPFYCLPTNHVHDKKGCPLCGIRYVPTTEGFISSANKIHNNKYNYDKVIYSLSKTLVIIGCSLHGEFMQTPNNHIEGMGCKKCGRNSARENLKQPIPEFIADANKVFGNSIYDYTNIKFNNHHDKISIICYKHGQFTTTPEYHLRGAGCPVCSCNKIIDKFIKNSHEIHKNKYNYAKVEYKNAKTKVIIICPVHGEFKQRPSEHISRNGCPKCKGCVSSIGTKWLQYLGVPTEYHEITMHIGNHKIRADAYVPETNTIYEFWGDYWHGNPTRFDKDDVNKQNKKTFGVLYNDTTIKRNLILDAGYNLVEIWENEFIFELTKQTFIKEIEMANLSAENIKRLKELIRDGVQVLQEVEDLKEGLKDTVKSIAEELAVKPSQINSLIKIHQKGSMNDKREAWDELEEMYKVSL